MKKLVLFVFMFFCGSVYSETKAQVHGDLLFWCARESGADNWSQVFNGNKVAIHQVDFGCDFGFRVGATTNLYYDKWDLSACYTWFRTTGKDSIKTEGRIDSSFLGNFYIGNSDGTALGPSYKKASIDWSLLFSMFDLALGRLCQVSDWFAVKPYIGLKGGWIPQSIDSKWQTPSANNFTSAKEEVDNDFWGIGPSAGVHLLWQLGSVGEHLFTLFGDFSGALLSGHWSFSDTYRNTANEKVVIKTQSMQSAATTFRAFMGMEWERDPFSVRLGYEAQFWPSQLQFYSLNTGRMNNLLTLQGGTLEIRYGF